MNHQEAVVLVGYVQACCPQQWFAEHTPDAWFDVLGDLTLGEARTAAAAVVRQQPFCSPHEIVREVYRARSADRPHSQACRSGDCRSCQTSWCECVHHGVPPRAITAAAGAR